MLRKPPSYFIRLGLAGLLLAAFCLVSSASVSAASAANCNKGAPAGPSGPVGVKCDKNGNQGNGNGNSGAASPSGGIGQGTGCTGSNCGHQCGASDEDPYTPAIDIGCKGQGNPITDALFALIRIASDGVGLVVIGSIIVGGIQYTASRGDPQSTAMAVNRIRSSVFALIIFIFGYAILNFIIPQGFLHL